MPRRKKDSRGYVREVGTYLGERYDLRAMTDKELDLKIKAKRAEIESGTKLIESNVTVKEWGQRWIKTYKTNVTKRTRGLIEGRIVRHINPHLGYMPVSKVRPLNCQECLNAAAGMAPDTIKKIAQAMAQMFEDARKNGLCRFNPATGLTMPQAGAETSHRSITDRERVILLETAKTHRAGPWALLLLYSGLRPSESTVLTYNDIQGGMISVNKAYDRSTGGVKKPKSRAGMRKVPIIPPLAEVLPRGGAPGELIFKNQINRQHSEKTVNRMWQSFRAAMAETEKQLAAAGTITPFGEAMPPMVPYDLRHTYCTDLERAGVPINVASKLMGHASISITAKIYTHTGEAMIEQAGAQLASLVSPTVSPTELGVNRCKTVDSRSLEEKTEIKSNVS